jgi:hypothetical protein
MHMTQPIPFMSPMRREDRRAIDAAPPRVIDGGGFVPGPEISASEADVARAFGVPSAGAAGRGPDAVMLAPGALHTCRVCRVGEVVTIRLSATARS